MILVSTEESGDLVLIHRSIELKASAVGLLIDEEYGVRIEDDKNEHIVFAVDDKRDITKIKNWVKKVRNYAFPDREKIKVTVKNINV